MENTEKFKFLISRFDNYISQANVKGNYLLAFNTFLIGIIVTNYIKIVELVDCIQIITVLKILLIILFLLSLFAAMFIIKAVYPFLNNNNSSKDGYHSHIFFNSVAEFENGNKYLESLNSCNNQFDSDMANQAYLLALGLKKKYNNLKYAIWCIYLEMVLILVILLIIVL